MQKTILHFLHLQSYNLSNFLKFQKALKFEQQKPKTKIQKLNNAAFLKYAQSGFNENLLLNVYEFGWRLTFLKVDFC